MPRPAEAIRAWVPRWWRGGGGAAGAALRMALAPAEAAYRAGVGARNTAYDRGWIGVTRAAIPVVSVGNLGVGGAGKTPFAAWVAGRIAASGGRPAIVLRGYGADEVAVHRELNPAVPVVQAPRRAAGVHDAVRRGCTVAVLDDAFQHRALARDVDIVLISTEAWAGVRHLLPRGPWREPVGSLRRADLVVVTRKASSREQSEVIADEIREMVPGVPVAVCHLRPTRLVEPGAGLHALEWLEGRRVLAVATLADPEPFVHQLGAAGAVPELLAFPDHHELSRADVIRIRAVAGDRPIVCTRKEAVKLVPLAPPGLRLLVLDQEVAMEQGAEAIDDVVALLATR